MIKELSTYIINIIYPQKCPICKRVKIQSDEVICDRCKKSFNQYRVNVSLKDEKGYEKGYAIFRYDGAIRFLIQKLKFKKDKKMANILASLIYEDVKAFCDRHHANFIVPIPIHSKRVEERGFNQSEVVAKILEKKLHKKVQSNLIKRTKYTKPQSLLPTVEKKENVKNSFGILNKEELKGKDVILFDDIYTTGSTIEECSKILKEHDTRKVYFLSISISNNKN